MAYFHRLGAQEKPPKNSFLTPQSFENKRVEKIGVLMDEARDLKTPPIVKVGLGWRD